MRNALATLALLAALGAPAALAAPAPVSLPRDHYGHASATIEWWYFSALVRDGAGTPYTVFFTLFASRGGLVPVSQVVDLHDGAVVGHTEGVGLGRVGPAALDVRVAGTHLRYAPATSTWSFSAAKPGFAISLAQRPRKPYALHGDGTGVIAQSLGGTSHYYSATRMSATGTLRAGGRTLRLSGESWLDHQWGDYRDDPRAFNWDWFSCRFDDGTELMLYQFRDRATGRPLTRYRAGTSVDRTGRATPVTSFAAAHGPRRLAAAGRRWPLDWQLRVPQLGLAESLRAVVPDQLVRNKLLPTFWEGAARATGSRTGSCYVELSYR